MKLSFCGNLINVPLIGRFMPSAHYFTYFAIYASLLATFLVCITEVLAVSED